MTPSPLSGKQLRHLRALAHPLAAVVQIGKQGFTEAVRAQIDEALLAHELIKVRLSEGAPLELDELATQVEAELGANVAQKIGRLLVVYRRHPKTPKIVLPRRTARS